MPDQIPLLEDTRWLITTLLAVWGAGLSTYHLLSLHLAKKPRIRVLLSKALIPSVPVTQLRGEPELVPAVSILIKNHGRVDVRFEPLCCELQVKGSQKGRIVVNARHIDPQLPATINHGQNIKMVTKVSDLEQAIKELSSSRHREVRAIAIDAIGRCFTSKWMEMRLPGEE